MAAHLLQIAVEVFLAVKLNVGHPEPAERREFACLDEFSKPCLSLCFGRLPGAKVLAMSEQLTS
jgi:hypothetical protein